MKKLKPVFRTLILLLLACCVLLAAGERADDNIRAFPYPYTAMLTIQSHIDGCTLEEFEAVHTFLNTKQNTAYGDGLGLDVGDSLWMYNLNDGTTYRALDNLPADSYMTWFAGGDPTKLNCAQEIQKYWAMGWIDSMHTLGDFSRRDETDIVFTRALAQTAWNALGAAGIRPSVWINHGTVSNVQNFGGYMPLKFTSYQQGDDPQSPYYHTDLTLAGGVRFVWNSNNGSELGMTDPLYRIRLRDGQQVWGFHAFTGLESPEGFQYTWTPYLLGSILTEENLDALAANRQYAVIATHFGSGTLWEILGEHNLPALRRLRDYQKDGKILVCRSSRLLEYAAVRKTLQYKMTGDSINIIAVDDYASGRYVPDADKLRGLTFYVGDSDTAALSIGGLPVAESLLSRNPADETGRESIGVRWWES